METKKCIVTGKTLFIAVTACTLDSNIFSILKTLKPGLGKSYVAMEAERSRLKASALINSVVDEVLLCLFGHHVRV